MDSDTFVFVPKKRERKSLDLPNNIAVENMSRWHTLVSCLEAKDEVQHCSETGDPWNILSLANLEKVSRAHDISTRQVKRIWDEYVLQRCKNRHELSLISNKHGNELKHGVPEEMVQTLSSSADNHHYATRYDNNGRPYTIEELVEAIAKVNNDCFQAISIRDLSAEMLLRLNIYVPKTTLWRILNDFHFDKEISHVKPLLTLKHKRKRLIYVLNQVDTSRIHQVGDRNCYKFVDHLNRVTNKTIELKTDCFLNVCL